MTSSSLASKKNSTPEEKKTIDELIDDIGIGYFHLYLVLANGLCITADAMEMMLLSIIGPLLKCQWALLDSQVALIAMAVFLGMAIGAFVFGWTADRYGRLPTLLLCTAFIAVYGCWSAASQSYAWIVVTRSIIGLGIGGVTPAMCTLTLELIPTSTRNKFAISVFSFWVFGVVLEGLFACLVIPTIGWRWLLVITSLPLFLSFVINYYILPESPRFLFVTGKSDKAKDVINMLARKNGKPLFLGEIVSDNTVVKERGQIGDLFHSNYVRLTLLLFVIWFAAHFCYYGNIFLSTSLLQERHRCLQDWDTMSSLDNKTTRSSAVASRAEDEDLSCCKNPTAEDYISTFISSLGEILGLLTSFLIMEFIGRRASLRINFLLLGPSFFFLNFCMPAFWRDALLFLNRMFASSLSIAGYLYTTEAYPTTVRAIGFGVCYTFSRTGAIITPLVSQYILTMYSVFWALCVYMLVAVAGFIAALCLPFDTRNRPLRLTVEESIYEASHDSQDGSDNARDYKTFYKSE